MGLRYVPPLARGNHRIRDAGPRHVGPASYWWRQVALLPVASADARGGVPGGVAADSPHERPGAAAEQPQAQGLVHCVGHAGRRGVERVDQRYQRDAEVSLCVARTPAAAAVHRAFQAHEGGHDCCGRGALHFAVGLRFPSSLPSDCRHTPVSPRSTCHCPHGNGYATGGRGYLFETADARLPPVPVEFRARKPGIHGFARRRQVQPPAANSEKGGRDRHRLHAQPQRHAACGPVSGGVGSVGDILSRRARFARARPSPAALDVRRVSGDGGHQCFRHGYRQARRALRGAHGHSRIAGGVFPGGRTRGAGREEIVCRASLRPFRRGAPPARPGGGLPFGETNPQRLQCPGQLLPCPRRGWRRHAVQLRHRTDLLQLQLCSARVLQRLPFPGEGGPHFYSHHRGCLFDSVYPRLA